MCIRDSTRTKLCSIPHGGFLLLAARVPEAHVPLVSIHRLESRKLLQQQLQLTDVSSYPPPLRPL
eukprot:463494-Hanusia_phi.AAC.1